MQLRWKAKLGITTLYISFVKFLYPKIANNIFSFRHSVQVQVQVQESRFCLLTFLCFGALVGCHDDRPRLGDSIRRKYAVTVKCLNHTRCFNIYHCCTCKYFCFICRLVVSRLDCTLRWAVIKCESAKMRKMTTHNMQNAP